MMLTKEDKINDSKKLNPIVKSLKGSFKMPENIDYKEEIEKRLAKKYIKNAAPACRTCRQTRPAR